MNKTLHALYGLKWNPFNPDIPTESLYIPPPMENFIWRIENNHVQEGGFALIVGDPGTGKSCLLRILSQKLNQVPGVSVGTFIHPQSSIRDFYHELGDMFDVPIKAHNRWHSFKSLRHRWQNHIENNCIKPVLLIDEAQEMQTSVMNELRLLNSHRYDSKNLLTVIFASNDSLLDRFRSTTRLIPLGSRIRKRLQMEQASSQQLLDCLNHLLEKAGNPTLLSETLMNTICDHSLGNYRIMTTLANELLEEACRQKLPHLDETLYFKVFAHSAQKNKNQNQNRK